MGGEAAFELLEMLEPLPWLRIQGSELRVLDLGCKV